jgi:signal transduction histidine kinase
MGVTELKPVITEAVDESRAEIEAKELGLQLHLPEHLSPILGNAHRLRQAIRNLVGNAIKYTPSGGQIVVGASDGKDHIMISVADNGIGIPLDEQAFVFDKFFRVDVPETRAIPGTGLGLSIVKSVVDKHGGRVWVESAPSRGSTFTVLLPKA